MRQPLDRALLQLAARAAVSRMNQFAVRPQSTRRSTPVMPDASSEARNAKAAATSAGRTRRRIGTRANWPLRYSIIFGPTARSVMSVCVKPGLTQFERMPCCASSSAIVRLRPSSARLGGVVARERAVAAARRRWRRCGRSRRRRCRAISRATRWAIRKQPVRFVSMTSRQRSSLHLQERRLVVDAGVVDRARRCGSQRSSAAATAARRPRDRADVGRVRPSAPPSVAHRRRTPPAARACARRAARRRPRREPRRGRLADAAAGAGDDDGFRSNAACPPPYPLTAPAVSPRMKYRWPKR